MKFEPLSHCPAHCADEASTAVLRVNFGTRARTSTVNRPVEITGSSTAAARGFLARMRHALARLFGRDSTTATDTDTRHHGCRCDVEARLLELETRKLNAQMLGNLRD
jgi:hypothetical protein